MRNEHLIIDGLDIIYTDRGTGPLLLFLHGWGTNASSFDALIEQFSNNRCVAISLPGFGGSENSQTPWGVFEYAQFVSHFLAKLKIEPEVIIAHSFGGRIALKSVGTKLIHPKKLVLIASAGVARKSARTKIFGILAKFVKALTAFPPLSFLRGFLKHFVGSRDYVNAGAMRETFVRVINENLEEDARKITVPSLLIWGEKDTETPLSEAYTLHERIPESQLEVISNTGHFVFQEQPRLVAEKIRNFL